MFDKLKNLLTKKPEPAIEEKPKPKAVRKKKTVPVEDVATVVSKPKPKTSRKKKVVTQTPLEIRRSEAKTKADLAKESWVDVVFTVDPKDPHNGYADIDWNDKFIADLVRHGYQIRPDDTDQDIVYRWYIEVCRNEVLETYAQEEAQSPTRFTKSRDIGDGFSEVS